MPLSNDAASRTRIMADNGAFDKNLEVSPHRARSIMAAAASQPKPLKLPFQETKDRVYGLIKSGQSKKLKALYACGEWTDPNEPLVSQPDGAAVVWHLTPLCLATTFKMLNVMQMLIDIGADVNEAREQHGMASYMSAVVGFIPGLNLLQSRGCDFTKSDGRAVTPAHGAAAHCP